MEPLCIVGDGHQRVCVTGVAHLLVIAMNNLKKASVKERCERDVAATLDDR